MPSFTQFLCGSCYKEFNFDKSGRKLFYFKAAPYYDRRSRRAGLHSGDKIYRYCLNVFIEKP
ncbi:hypothetical protein NECAME_13382 [Necator americanus]|uniref:Uncharacterized protein n=1 Tax=Necator americanus TaxID=51031 RepID=W2SWJ6_NECAM|nr:hypothetical protein NECAME_13382 [Necator americanus]ETN73873.1 hypothetical protein NECAME_13382 [Necator americanus]